MSCIDPITECSGHLEMATTWEISQIEFQAMLRLFQDTVDLTKCKDSHQLLSHHLVVKVFIMQMDQHLLSQFVVVVYLEFRICYIAKYLVTMEKVKTQAFFIA